MNKETTPKIEIDDEFAEIIEREFSANTSKALGGTAMSQVEPFGHQFMGDASESPANPKATTPGGQTVTLDNNGQPGKDDPTSNDVS
ncbi:MAG: hypothetical protein JWP06_617 [Candidatus Saccharibacteria bacterium]|nr:hypothetical protein [Candidatus Saccharibacteria bacterium]